MKRVLVPIVFGLAILPAGVAVRAQEPHRWETGTILSQKLTSTSNTIFVNTGAYSYVWQELTRSPNRHNFIVLTGDDQTVHGAVKFYRDGQWFVVLDKEGQEHKFSLIRSAKSE